MKQYYYYFLVLWLLFISLSVKSQNNVGIGTKMPNSNAMLDITASDKGLLIPRMTTSQRNAIPINASCNGLLVYDTDYDMFWYTDGNAWYQALGPMGPTGPTGPSGADGAAGTNGSKGLDGKDGSTGPTGQNGVAGVTGPTGPTNIDSLTVQYASFDSVFSQYASFDTVFASYANFDSLYVGGTNIIDIIDSTVNAGNANNWSINGNTGISSSNFLGTTDSKDLIFKTTNTERLRILSTGNVGIGTSAPVANMQVNGSSTEGVLLISPNVSSSGGNSVLELAEDRNNTYGMSLKYDGGDNQLQVFGKSGSTTYGPHLTIERGNGDVAITDGDLSVDTGNVTVSLGNVNVSKGYLSVGATTSSITRYASQEVHYSTNDDVYDATAYHYNIGTINIPTGASSISVYRLDFQLDGKHDDGNEDHYIKVRLGTNSWVGSTLTCATGSYYIYENYSGDLTYNNLTSSSDRSIDLELYDGTGGLFSTADHLYFYDINVTVYYTYTLALQAGDIAAGGRIYANNNTSVGDLAEYFPVSGAISNGMIVSLVPGGSDDQYKLSDKPYDQFMVGVVSENPSVMLNSTQVGPPVALTGRVKVKLAHSDKLIKSGDFLTTSDKPGCAQLATKAGPIIGYAVKNQKAGEDFVQILVQPGRYYIPSTNDSNDSTK